MFCNVFLQFIHAQNLNEIQTKRDLKRDQQSKWFFGQIATIRGLLNNPDDCFEKNCE